jgi:WD40 repeat protein
MLEDQRIELLELKSGLVETWWFETLEYGNVVFALSLGARVVAYLDDHEQASGRVLLLERNSNTRRSIENALLTPHRWFAQLAFSPVDEDALVVGSSSRGASRIELFSLKDSTVQRALVGHRGWLNAVAFSADGQRLISAGHDQTARVWALP